MDLDESIGLEGAQEGAVPRRVTATVVNGGGGGHAGVARVRQRVPLEGFSLGTVCGRESS